MNLWKVKIDKKGMLLLVTDTIESKYIVPIFRDVVNNVIVHTFANDGEEAINIAKRMILNEEV